MIPYLFLSIIVKISIFNVPTKEMKTKEKI